MARQRGCDVSDNLRVSPPRPLVLTGGCRHISSAPQVILCAGLRRGSVSPTLQTTQSANAGSLASYRCDAC
jgi:hypothetical protein